MITSFFKVGPQDRAIGKHEEDGPIAKAIEKRGEGIHHIAYEVADIREEMARLKAEGFTLLSEEPSAARTINWCVSSTRKVPVGCGGIVSEWHRHFQRRVISRSAPTQWSPTIGFGWHNRIATGHIPHRPCRYAVQFLICIHQIFPHYLRSIYGRSNNPIWPPTSQYPLCPDPRTQHADLPCVHPPHAGMSHQ